MRKKLWLACLKDVIKLYRLFNTTYKKFLYVKPEILSTEAIYVSNSD